MRRPIACSVSFVAALALTLAACGDGKKAPLPAAGADPAKAGDPAAGGPATAASAASAASAEDALIEKYKKDIQLPIVHYEWDKNAGDKSVSAELGGPGFTGEGWTTRLEYPSTSWAAAPKGGSLRIALGDWPATLRVIGENSNTLFNSWMESLSVETLLAFNTVVMDYVPLVATHWWISADKQTYRFRINPEARWSNGSELTAEDFVASWDLRMDPKTRAPMEAIVYGKFDRPVAKSKYILEVHCKEDNWRNFYYFSASLFAVPSNELSIPGDVYLDKYQNAYPAVSGGYMVLPEDVKMGEQITVTRRKDWWGEKNPANAGTWNIDKLIFTVVKDPGLAYEKVKKGEIDFWSVPKAQWWAQEISQFDSVKRGLLQMRKVFNNAPIGTNGYAMNMKRPPFDDVRVRKAMQLLYNRKQMIEKLCFNEYLPLKSYYQGDVYMSPESKEEPYDPVAAVELLEQAGWTETNKELYRVKNGKVLEFEVIYQTKLSERFLTTYQDDCRKAGIKMNLKLMDESSFWDTETKKQFDVADGGFTGLVFPNPETQWSGSLADQTANNNITGFNDARVDALLKEYDSSYDMKRRMEVMHQIDAILQEIYPYALAWYNPAQRFVYWNKFGMPPWGCGRTDRVDQIFLSFWVDPAKEKALEEARKDPSKSMPVEERENRWWQAWNAAERRKQAGGGK